MPKILVIDDVQAICWAFDKLLTPKGYEVLTAASAEAGLDICQQQQPDLCILDIRLPGISGLEAISVFKERAPAMPILIIGAACSDRDPTGLELARADIDPVVFDDAYGEGVYFQPFFETHYTAVEVDSVHAYNGFAPDGARSLKINVPPQGSALGAYSGGVLTSSAKRDLADYNALTFYARADEDVSLDVVGFGNDNTGTSLYEAGRNGIPLTQDWVFVTVPIPAPSKLIAERGLLTFAEGLEQVPPNSGIYPYPNGYNIWLDEVRFAKLGNIEIFRANMRSVNGQYFIGSTVSVDNTSTVFTMDGAFVPINHMPSYFDYTSSNSSVAVVERGEIKVIGEGQAVITAKLEELDVNGTITVTGNQPPTEAAAPPAIPAEDVISMFSDVYNDVLVDTWRADWGGSLAQLEEYVVAGSNTKMYSSLNFVGITFETSKIDATDMTHFHLDVYAPAGTNFRIKLVSFPPQLSAGVQTGDLILDSNSTPAFNAGAWSSLDIPLSGFQLPDDWDWSQVGQLVLSTTDAQLVLVDNVYWHR